MEVTKNVQEKKRVALTSVFAAVLLTGSKTVIGVLTGSLGILSEALHSGLDLIAAVITYFSVRVSDRPADEDHHYGHGKIENFSALVETLLLFITCIWIVYEAVNRLMTGKLEIDVNFWSYIVVVASIVIDYSRSRALMRAAKKHHSQALEADALHFSTDIWSSVVVLLGLICAQFGIFAADAIAGLVVACIVIYISYKLGKKAIDVLLDKAPVDNVQIVENIIKSIPEVLRFHDLKIRNAGADIFIELTIHVNPTLNINDAHQIAHNVENRISEQILNCKVHVHEEPEDIS
jgi:cation diffusion facilitator family transporter